MEDSEELTMMKRAMYFVAVIAMVMRTAGAWSVNRHGGRAAFVRKDASNNNEKKKNELKINIAKKEGASYLRVADTLDYPKRKKNMVGASHQRMADTFKTANKNAADEIESSADFEELQKAKELSAFDVDGIIIEGTSAKYLGTEWKRLSPSDESRNDRSIRAGNDEDKEKMIEDWRGDGKKRDDKMNAASRDGIDLDLSLIHI